MDVLPTLAKLAGAKLPERRIDGKDIWPLMSSQPGARSPHNAIFYYRGWRLDAIRSGRWKLHLPHPYLSFAEPGSGGKPGRYDRKKIELSLFDLKKDIAEQHNLVHQRPDVVERLMKLVDKMRQDLGDSAKNTKGKNRRPAGHI
jgi:arylsulfatase A